MHKKIIFGLFLTASLISAKIYSQDIPEILTEERYPADSLKLWTMDLMKEINKIHPGFYRYTSKPEFDEIINTTISSFEKPLTTVEYYRRLKPLFAKIGCLHTEITLTDEFQELHNSKFKLLPFDIFIDKDARVLVSKVYSKENDLKVGDQLLAINNRSINEIIADLRASIPSDGNNQTLKTLMLNHRFSFWYRSIIQNQNTFLVKVERKNTSKEFYLNGISANVFPSMESILQLDEEQLQFNIEDNIGILKIKSFAKSAIKRNGQHFKRFIKSVFKTLEKENIQDLIIDLRYNSGGTDGNAVFLTSHFFDEPFEYWDRIEVTEEVANQITGINRVFYQKPTKLDSVYLWKGALLTKEFDYYKTQYPAKNSFKGNTYIITNGLCMSSCSDVVAILSENSKAIIVGEETGGGYQGNTSGDMPTELINGNMQVTIPLHKYVNAVSENKNFGTGTIPDFKVNPTIEQWIIKEDAEMEFIKNNLINAKE